MYNLTSEINELNLLIESTKDEFNDYAESLLSEYAFDEVKPLLESAHFEAELIVTEAEDSKVNKLKEKFDAAKKKITDKFNSPAYTKKCKEIEDAIKEDPSVGEQLVEVPKTESTLKMIVSNAKKIVSKGSSALDDQLDLEIEQQTEQITLKKLMLKRKRIQTAIVVSIGVVAGIVIPFMIGFKVGVDEQKLMVSNKSDEEINEQMISKVALMKITNLISYIVQIATLFYGTIMAIRLVSLKKDIKGREKLLENMTTSKKVNGVLKQMTSDKAVTESYFDSLFDY